MNKEIKKLEQSLQKSGVTSPGFKTPKKYFDEFYDTLNLKIAEDTFPDTTGLNVPQDYFNNLADSIVSKVERKDTSKKKTLIRILYTASSIAAALLLYISISINSDSQKINFESISEIDFENYISEGNMALDIYSLTEQNETIAMSDIFYDDISKQEATDYLNSVSTDFLLIDN